MHRHLALLTIASALAALPVQAQRPPWAPDDPPPAVAGIHLGDQRAQLDAVLGTPAHVQEIQRGVALLGYEKGILVLWNQLEGVKHIYLQTPEAGAVGDFRVGDDLAAVQTRWGPPTQTQAHDHYYLFGTRWSITFRTDGRGKILMVGVGVIDVL